MKLFWIGIFTLFISACGAHTIQDKTMEPKYASDSFIRTGEISVEELITRYVKFAHQYEQYSVDAKEASDFSVLKEVEFVVMFGLWCHDSQREIPRLIKLMEKADISTDKIKLIAIDMEKNVPDEFSSQFSIQYTPTIFVTQENQVIAKVVEKPKNSLAKDILSQILH